ncbi:MAG: hypothetical protein H8K10_15585 [Nitrospira sp.]|nr:hypothetical protein [Nitrospira sp.]
MSCEHVQFKGDDGRTVNVIVCTRGRRQKFCRVGFCNKPAVALCDYPVTDEHGKHATCDAPMCEQHRHPVPGLTDRDWCNAHWSFEQRRKSQPLKGELPLTFEG